MGSNDLFCTCKLQKSLCTDILYEEAGGGGGGSLKLQYIFIPNISIIQNLHNVY